MLSEKSGRSRENSAIKVVAERIQRNPLREQIIISSKKRQMSRIIKMDSSLEFTAGHTGQRSSLPEPKGRLNQNNKQQL